jgi:hypothetical protein
VRKPHETRPAKQARNRPKRPGHRTSTTWQKGQCGNPAGRPRSGHALAEVLRAYLEDPHGHSGVSRKWHLVDQLYKLATARHPSVPAARLLLERADSDDLERTIADLETRLSALQAERAREREQEESA